MCGLACWFSALKTVALDWQPGSGFRSAELAVGRSGKTGFTLLPPSTTGIEFSNQLSDLKAAENQIRLNGSGVAAGDVDGDGLVDLYFCRLEGPNALYRNLGGWKFQDITPSAGVACGDQYSTGAVFSDVDGDGDLDLLVNSIGGGTRLFLNDGKGHFAEAFDAGLVRKFCGMSMALADVDGDGDLDLYVANYRSTTIRSTGLDLLNVNGRRMIRPQDRDQYEITPEGAIREHGEPDILYRNDGKGRFLPVLWTDGSFLDEQGKPLSVPPKDWGQSVMFRDLNSDGAPDIYVCNDFWSPDRIWINDGIGRFRAVARTALPDTSTFSMGIDFADINRDGLDEFIVLDMLSPVHQRRMTQFSETGAASLAPGLGGERPQVGRNTLFLNRGDGTYAEIARFSGVEATEWSWCPVFLDVDLDGYEDILISTGNRFDTQDSDAEARIQSMGPWPREKVPSKLLMYPALPLPAQAFHNERNLKFREVGHTWGFTTPGVAQGMCVADLDNDGGLDVVVNNLNGAAGIYRNVGSAPRVAVRLKGLPPNTRGIGAKLWLYSGAVPVQSQEMICGGRYLSSDDPMRVFAAGSLTNEMRIEVQWRSGKRSVINRVKANRAYEIDEAAAEGNSKLKAQSSREDPRPKTLDPTTSLQPFFEDVSRLLNHTHHEEPFEDRERQPLLTKRFSQLGPGVAWFDVDGDGWEDFIVGSGKGGVLAVYHNDERGGFQRLTSGPVTRIATRDQAAVLGWRKAPGQTVILAGSANYEDGLAVGAAVRQYDLANQTVDDSLPGQASSTGPLALGQWHGDGMMSLFVGGRVIPGRYPEAASSMMFQWKEGKWETDVENTKGLAGAGLVSGAVFSDLDGDGKPELILACEWGPIRIFRNDRGKLVPWDAPVSINPVKGRGPTGLYAHQHSTINQLTGWWNGVTTGDLDGDGRLDIIASNWGRNTRHESHRTKPLRIYYGDFDGSGRINLIEAYYDLELKKMAPEEGLDFAARAMPFLRERFPTHRSYAEASVADILGEAMQKAQEHSAARLESMVFLNRGDHFEARPLPDEAQWAPAFAVCVGDYDGDGNEDVFLSQNFFAVVPDSSRCDAGRGLWLKGDGQGNLRAVPGQESGIQVYGEQRGAALCDYDGDGRVDLAVTQNGAETKLYHNVGGRPGLRVRLAGTTANPQAVGAQLRLSFGSRQGPMREIHAGSGYWSQDSDVQVLGTPEFPTQLQVRWPGGQGLMYNLASVAKEILVQPDGNLKVLR